ncbi:uncharacterized protein LOC119674437, partial [Teleopsis dalmanni]|uniref:uncharacterized protein LOC119674437 n=1 Tax=Teleopsis dalmanni TaxID=139649 RepID=UPI0018CD6FAA
RKRKRKHKELETGQEEETVVPTKVAKQSKPKKHKKKASISDKTNNEPNDEQLFEEDPVPDDGAIAGGPLLKASAAKSETNNDSGFEETKFSKDFKMLNFREKLRGNNFITELRHFLHLAHTRPQIIAKYIEKRGKPLELAEALERIDKTNAAHVNYVCEALQLVVMEIITNQKDHMESAVHACRYFLKSYGSTLELLLQSTQLQHRRTALKLLTAIVCAEPQLGRQILSSYDVLSNVKTIENLLSHSKFEINDSETVRKCFIHFVLAYLIDGNTLLIRNILDRGALLRGLASGLIYDDHVTACVVISTLRQYVLECAEISKTKKTNVFDLECCKHFVRLYDWQGPKVYAAKASKKQKTDLMPKEIQEIVDADERDAVASAAHEFLVILLTSRKHGITFDAITHFREKHNSIQGKLLGFLYKPWCDTRKIELVVKVLLACPELARHTVRHFSGIVNPMRTIARDWVAAVNFLNTIIATLHPKLLGSALEKLTITDFTYWIKDICLPVETLVLLTGAKMLKHQQFSFRLATNRLLLTMFTQYQNYVEIVRKREQVKSGNSLRRFKFDLLNHILVNFPTVEDILNSLYASIQLQHNEDVNVLEHLDVALDLLLVICKENQAFVNKTSTIIDYIKLLRPLYQTENSANIKLELKAIKTILLLFPKALEPGEELFNNVLTSFIKAFVFGSGDVQREAGELLRGIFINTGIFDSGELEIDLWLEALRFCDAETVDIVTQVFNEVLQVTKLEVEQIKTDEKVENSKSLQKLFENIEQGLTLQAYIETLSISKLMPLIFKGVEIEEQLGKYLETVCLLMYHYYPMPSHVYKLYEMKFEQLKSYMESWLPGNEREPIQLTGSWAKVVPYMQSVQSAVLKGDLDFINIFCKSSADHTLEVEVMGKQLKLPGIFCNERLVMLYVQQVLFLVAQLTVKQLLTRVQAQKSADLLINLLSVIRKTDEKRCEANAAVEEQTNVSFIQKMIKYIFSVRIAHINTADLLNANSETNLNFIYFLYQITEYCNVLPDFTLHSTNYRLKIVKAVGISLQSLEETVTHSSKLLDGISLIKALNLETEDCIEILNLVINKIKYTDLFVSDGTTKSFYYELLVCVLMRLAGLQNAIKCNDFIKKFAKLYINFVKKLGQERQVEELEEAFYNFLLLYHQNIKLLSVKFFSSLLTERKTSKSSIKLACLLLSRDTKLHQEFITQLPEKITKKELIYPLLSTAFKQNLLFESSLLQSIYQEYKNGFMKTIEKPQKAGVIYKEHADCSIALIERCMPKSECVDFCNKNLKVDAVELFQMRIINAIYKKAYNSLDENALEQKANIFVNYINLQIQMLSTDMKKSIVDTNKIELFAFMLYDWWQSAYTDVAEKTLPFEANYSKILHNQQWLNFCKTSLKTAMQINESELKIAEADQRNGLILKLLAYICGNLYTLEEGGEGSSASQLFDIICTHSKFYDIILQTTNTQVKTQVLHLLYVLAKKAPSALNQSQIPFILGAYQAKLTLADRYTLGLLELYELHDCGLQQYRPYIWGESAVAFYALRSTDEERTKLKQQETSIEQVMSLIDRQVCEYTLTNFPIWRKLHVGQQMPSICFENPELKALRFGTNSLERSIESGTTAFVAAEMLICPKRDGIYEQCYDPAFVVPLMIMCFSPEAYAHPARPVQNGLLAVAFAALSSQDRDMRLAAGCVQLRYRAHFENSKFFERPLWIQTYENIQAGLSELRDAWMKHKKSHSTPRVPYISGLFIAKTFNITTDSTHLLYKQLTMYLRLKSTFNFQCIPEFNVLFYSHEVEHQQFRRFILEVICNGIKCSSDLFLLVSTNTFKVLMGFYGSTMSTLDINLLILSIFSTCAKIPGSIKIIIENVGLLSWLSSIVNSTEFYQFDVIEGLITVINNLWYSLKASAAQFHNIEHLNADIYRLILLLLPLLSPRISVGNFSKLLNIMQKTAGSKQSYRALSSDQLDKLIGCAQRHFPKYVQNIESIKKNGGDGAATHVEYCQDLHSQGESSMTVLALSSLRGYVIDWWSNSNIDALTNTTVVDDLNITEI